MLAVETHNKSKIIKEERRRYKRGIFNARIELISAHGKSVIKCASFDLAEGGIRVVTHIELKEPTYVVCLDGLKLNSRLVYEEVRKSSMMNQTAFYHGLKFEKPITSDIKAKLLKSAEKFRL